MRNKETYYGEIVKAPEVIGRQVHIEVAIAQDPRRPYIITLPLSDGKKFIRSFSRALAKAGAMPEVNARPFDGEDDV